MYEIDKSVHGKESQEHVGEDAMVLDHQLVGIDEAWG